MAAGSLAAARSSSRLEPARLEPARLAALAAVGPATALVGAWAIGLGGWFNDFHVYYLAGRLVASGRSPYDEPALVALGHSLNLEFLSGGGYSYPPPFAVAMAPLSLLPFGLATALFVAASIAAFAATVAWWLPRVLSDVSDRARAGLALAAGFYPPVAGSVFAGQVNLFVFALMGIGLAPFIVTASEGRSDEARGPVRPMVAGAALGLAGIVKLAPLALAVPLALARAARARDALVGLFVAAGASLVVAGVLAPQSLGGAGTLGALFAPDPFSTNQSVNGAVSRLFLDGDRTVAVVAGDPAPWAIAATALLGVATLVVLVRGLRGRGSDRRLALGLALALVAAAAGAPKNSFWNDAPVLLAVALAASADAFATRWPRLLGSVWLAATIIQFAVDRLLADPGVRGWPVWTLASEAGLVALLALWLTIAFALNRSPGASIANASVRRSEGGA